MGKGIIYTVKSFGLNNVNDRCLTLWYKNSEYSLNIPLFEALIEAGYWSPVPDDVTIIHARNTSINECGVDCIGRR